MILEVVVSNFNTSIKQWPDQHNNPNVHEGSTIQPAITKGSTPNTKFTTELKGRNVGTSRF